jgi:methylenetetrahydrofolate dehydrogenase (NADP+) / methenyltetrahydrofolate cyclohydrolase
MRLLYNNLMIFDGKAFAREIEERVKASVAIMRVKPKIVSVLVGNDPSSELYTKLKKQAAERVRIAFEVMRLEPENLHNRITQIADDASVTGLMVQLPVPGLSAEQTREMLTAIPLSKDVDGLRWEESGVKPAVVRAVLSIVDRIAQDKKTFAVLGSAGAVGRPLVQFLCEQGREVFEIEQNTANPQELVRSAQVVISCVGKAGLVTGEMVGEGAIMIDVGMSEVEGRVVGDMAPEVYQKASVAVTVPGGVGPVTVASLMENAVTLL